MSTAQVERVITSGIFALDGGEWQVDNNVWLLGDDREVIIVDAAHDARAIAAAVGSRTVLAIVCTHGHNDHIGAALDLAELVSAPVLLHPGDRMLWDQTHPGRAPGVLVEGAGLSVAGVDVEVINTPGHSPGSCVLHVPALGVLFSGDTLFQGGPGATGRSYSDFDAIIASISQRLLTLPAETRVLTGHGDETTIGTEAPHLQEWIDRGH
ncbi:MBL fold metallo-hydrolase [Propionibacteriaceae bacterium G57]|uniref:MBL fold metallo-hydrolase n=1 Tax=Aestuariimicrobium sp. G57 TaxID=3418485 RepID=UPI003DA762C5